MPAAADDKLLFVPLHLAEDLLPGDQHGAALRDGPGLLQVRGEELAALGRTIPA